jgi:hypothetical protein
MATAGAPCASWRGLLENGIAWCERQGWWSRGKIVVCRSLLEEQELPLAAQMIKKRMDEAGAQFYAEWLHDALADLPGHDHVALRAVHDLDAPLITLNYDPLLELSSPRRLDPIT